MVAAEVMSGDAAAWNGIAAPLVLGLFLGVGSRLRSGYDRSRDTMSKLGDGVDAAAVGFLVINLAIGWLLFAFARWLVRPEFGNVWWLVAVTAVGSAIIAVTPGNETSRFPGIPGRPRRQFHAAHLAAAGVNVVLMGAIPIVVLVAGLGWTSPWYRRANAAIAIAFPIVVAVVAAALVLGRRQLRTRLILAGEGTTSVAERPWEAPRHWLDRDGWGERLLWAVGYSWVVATATEQLWPGWSATCAAIFFVVALGAILWPQRVVPLVRFSTETCQDNTVYGMTPHHAEFRLMRIVDTDAFRTSLRAALAELAEHAAAVRRSSDKPDYMVTIGFTYDGVRRLGEPYRWTSAVDDVFAQGMARRRALLGDRDGDWDEGWADADVAVWAVARHHDGLAAARGAMNRLDGVVPACAVLHGRVGTAGDASPFHFADGVSEPWIHAVPVHRARDASARRRDPRGGGKLATYGRWQPLALGEFVLGQVDEANDVFPVPEPAPLFVGATFAAVRHLALQRERLDTVVEALSGAGGAEDDDEVLALLVGRTADGTPLMGGASRSNRFRYFADPHGLRCPITAHVRRANPRDSLGFGGLLANRRRMIRRGVPVMDGFEQGDHGLTGLLFIALQARLHDQFEFVQQRWLNDGAAFGLGRDPDVLGGHWDDDTRQVVLPSPGLPVAALLPGPIVVARGGAYLVVPSIRGLHYLARHAPASPADPAPASPVPDRRLAAAPAGVRG